MLENHLSCRTTTEASRRLTVIIQVTWITRRYPVAPTFWIRLWTRFYTRLAERNFTAQA